MKKLLIAGLAALTVGVVATVVVKNNKKKKVAKATDGDNKDMNDIEDSYIIETTDLTDQLIVELKTAKLSLTKKLFLVKGEGSELKEQRRKIKKMIVALSDNIKKTHEIKEILSRYKSTDSPDVLIATIKTIEDISESIKETMIIAK